MCLGEEITTDELAVGAELGGIDRRDVQRFEPAVLLAYVPIGEASHRLVERFEGARERERVPGERGSPAISRVLAIPREQPEEQETPDPEGDRDGERQDRIHHEYKHNDG